MPSDAIAGLLGAMNLFDSEMGLHLTATAAFAERTALVLALDATTVENCRVGALLHDIGRVAIDKSILTHPGMLTDAEWEIVADHAVYGARLLQGIPALRHLVPIVRGHHERFDGSGYPDGLVGSEIPIESRVIAVADAFHTMSMPQAYREASTATTAMAELVGNSGSQFDPDVVEAFATVIGFRQRRRRQA